MLTTFLNGEKSSTVKSLSRKANILSNIIRVIVGSTVHHSTELRTVARGLWKGRFSCCDSAPMSIPNGSQFSILDTVHSVYSLNALGRWTVVREGISTGKQWQERVPSRMILFWYKSALLQSVRVVSVVSLGRSNHCGIPLQLLRIISVPPDSKQNASSPSWMEVNLGRSIHHPLSCRSTFQH